MSAARGALRVGIDVGGTFTDVVVVDAATRAIVARVKVPTSHDAPEGVAAGIVAGLVRALAAPGVDAARIAFVAHSTTQATNALLEGDVARVGILALLSRAALVERGQLRVPPIELAPGALFAPAIVFARAGDAVDVAAALERLAALGVEAVAVSAAFGVDAPAPERAATEAARARGFAATAGHEVASTYGLRARTRTAALNAAILPRMQRTSATTARAVADAGIGVSLMIMRSDGGVMDVAEVARRPILTMLSGPAAGIAGALLHENVTDGIFIEVGGTSADCSAIRRGRPELRPARVGGHRTMLRTLDARTLAIAGGSVPRIDLAARGLGALRDVGPRSAHIAGLAYACFLAPAELDGATVTTIRPRPGDPGDYLALELGDGRRATLTPTCAANLLGYVPAGDFARGDDASARAAFALVGDAIGVAGDALARALLERAAEKLRVAIDELVADYELPRDALELVGGGGGAAALVPFAAERLRLPFRLARDAEVISPLGVALALVRDTVERTIVGPTPADVVRVRREAFDRAVASGADPAMTTVTVEIDARRNLVRATASGSSGGAIAVATVVVPDDERLALAARTLRLPVAELAFVFATEELAIAFASARGRRHAAACVIDARGVVRSASRDAVVRVTTSERVERELVRVLDDATAFGDVGRALPDVALVYGGSVAELGALAEAAQLVALAREELRGAASDAPVAIVATRRSA